MFHDDFSVDVPLGSFPTNSDGTWKSYLPTWRDTSGNGLYSTALVVSVANGMLDKYIHTTSDGIHRVAAIEPMGGARGLLYGRYEVRARMDLIDGYKVAWLLWPTSNVWPRDGEIDFPERNLISTGVFGFVHHQGATTGSDQYSVLVSPFDATQWHTYTTEWSPGRVRFLLDGDQIGTTTDRIPNTPMNWVLQTETRLSGGEPPDSSSGHIQIDYVTVWSYSNG